MAKIVFFLLFFLSLNAKRIHKDQTGIEIQQSLGTVRGVTPKESPISAKTLQQLAEVGIDLIFKAPACPKEEPTPPIHWENGTLFFINFNQKGDFFQKWFKHSKLYPKKIIFIDDRKEHLE